MALYHFSVKQVSRGKGQTVVNSAAYISGQKLYNDYYGQTHDYTKKSGVVFTEILTPEYVPERLSDRQHLIQVGSILHGHSYHRQMQQVHITCLKRM